MRAAYIVENRNESIFLEKKFNLKHPILTVERKRSYPMILFFNNEEGYAADLQHCFYNCVECSSIDGIMCERELPRIFVKELLRVDKLKRLLK